MIFSKSHCCSVLLRRLQAPYARSVARHRVAAAPSVAPCAGILWVARPEICCWGCWCDYVSHRPVAGGFRGRPDVVWNAIPMGAGDFCGKPAADR
jgi:hypothetical protein